MQMCKWDRMHLVVKLFDVEQFRMNELKVKCKMNFNFNDDVFSYIGT